MVAMCEPYKASHCDIPLDMGEMSIHTIAGLNTEASQLFMWDDGAS